ncbi:MAG: hypothetical protein CGW95_01090 [Phenylobacterium zucineum]|nr:MAG: hypothetical protein CGW95_01090 [Phenylobacterium zucineum]
MKTFLYFLAALVLMPVAAFAADGTAINIPVGSWISDASGILSAVLVPVLLALVARLLAVLPKPIADFVKTLQVEQLLTRAVSYGINAVKDAEHDKVLSVNVGNAVVAEAANYAIQNGPKWIVDWLGGPDGIKQRILARVKLEPAASLGAQSSTEG